MIYNLLYPFQKSIIDKYKERHFFGLFLDMGLGKTAIATAFTEVNQCTKILIISINSKATESINEKGSWLDWMQKSNDFKQFSKSQKNLSEFNDGVMLINYEALFQRTKDKTLVLSNIINNFINKCQNEKVAIILDESHKIKNPSSTTSKAIEEIKRLLTRQKNELYIYLLTGTPFTIGYIDLFNQLKFLGCKMTKTKFIDNFCVRGRIRGLYEWQQPIVGYKNVEELFNLVHQYSITIKSNEVINLPDQIFKEILLPCSKEFKLFTTCKKDNRQFRDIDYPTSRWIALNSTEFWLRSRQLSIGFQGNAEESKWFNKERIKSLEKFLADNPDNYVLFFNFVPELTEIYDVCEKLGYNIDVYTGDIKNLDNYNKFANLSKSEKLTANKNIILSNFASGSVGKNWQEYNKCIIFSLPLYKDYEQGIKRIHRTGQSKTTFYYIFSSDNFLDKKMLKSLEEKIDYSKEMFEADLEREQK